MNVLEWSCIGMKLVILKEKCGGFKMKMNIGTNDLSVGD